MPSDYDEMAGFPRHCRLAGGDKYMDFLKKYNADEEYIEGAIDGFEECKRKVINILNKIFFQSLEGK